MQDEDAQILRGFMSKTRVNQKDLASKAGVSQATVSRALLGRVERTGRAKAKLFTYIQQASAATAVLPAEEGANIVLQAFGRIWDRSPVHAVAVARVIDAMDGLKPANSPKE